MPVLSSPYCVITELIPSIYIFPKHWIWIHSKVPDFEVQNLFDPCCFKCLNKCDSMCGIFNPLMHDCQLKWDVLLYQFFHPIRKRSRYPVYCFMTWSGGIDKTVKHWTNIGNANVLMISTPYTGWAKQMLHLLNFCQFHNN